MSNPTARVNIPQELYKHLKEQYGSTIIFRGYIDQDLEETFAKNEKWSEITDKIKKLYRERKGIEEDIMVKQVINKLK